jgi:EmrB/QacA subfamily drug resistance transporter
MGQYGYTPVRREPADRRRAVVLLLLGLAFFLTMLDGTIVYVAMPRIHHELGFTNGVHWVMTAYLLSFGALLLLGGRLAELFGPKRMFRIGVAAFTAGSLACGIAWSPGALVAGRAVQGIGAALLAPTTLPLVVVHADTDAARGRALGLWTVIGAFAGTVGFLVGGPLTDGPGWRWIFLVNVPLGLGILVLGAVLAAVRDEAAPRRVDVAGALTLAAALVLLVVAVAGTAQAGWAGTRTLVLLLASAAAFTVFAGIERRAREPLVPLRILRSRPRLGGMVVLLTAGVVVDGLSFLLTLYMQHALGLSATRFGLLMTVMTLSAVVGSVVGQALVVRFGMRPLAAAGMVLIGVGCLLLTAVSVNGSFFDDVFTGLLTFGPGLGAAFVSAQVAVVSGARAAESGTASGIADAAFSIGGALGLAILSSVVVSHGHGRLADAAQAASPLVLTAGVRQAFAVAVAIAVLGLAAALALPGRPSPCAGLPRS